MMEPQVKCGKRDGFCRFVIMRHDDTPSTIRWHCPECKLTLKQLWIQMPVVHESKPLFMIGFVVEKEGDQ